MKNQRLNDVNDAVFFAFEEVDITPEKPMKTIGFGREDEESRGVLGRIFGQVSLWKNEKEICCLIAIDHIGFSKDHCNHLRRAIGKALGIEKEKVINETIQKAGGNCIYLHCYTNECRLF